MPVLKKFDPNSETELFNAFKNLKDNEIIELGVENSPLGHYTLLYGFLKPNKVGGAEYRQRRVKNGKVIEETVALTTLKSYTQACNAAYSLRDITDHQRKRDIHIDWYLYQYKDKEELTKFIESKT